MLFSSWLLSLKWTFWRQGEDNLFQDLTFTFLLFQYTEVISQWSSQQYMTGKPSTSCSLLHFLICFCTHLNWKRSACEHCILLLLFWARQAWSTEHRVKMGKCDLHCSCDSTAHGASGHLSPLMSPEPLRDSSCRQLGHWVELRWNSHRTRVYNLWKKG